MVEKVKVSGKGLEYPRSQEYNEILIDCRRVYLKDHKLRCSVKSPSRSSAMVKLQDNLDGTYSMFFKPTFTGAFLVNIRIDDIHVKGSPFKVMVKSWTSRSLLRDLLVYSAITIHLSLISPLGMQLTINKLHYNLFWHTNVLNDV